MSFIGGLLLAAASDVPVDDNAPIFHVSPAGCRGGVAPLHHGWTNGAPAMRVSPSLSFSLPCFFRSFLLSAFLAIFNSFSNSFTVFVIYYILLYYIVVSPYRQYIFLHPFQTSSSFSSMEGEELE